MAEQVELEIAPREVVGKSTKRLRRAGIIPANISGHNQPPQAVQLDAVTFERLRRTHHTRNILSLRLPGAEPQTALVQHIQHDPRSGKILHVDFSRVSMSERVTVRLRLHPVGDAPAVKNEGGVLLHPIDAIEVECVASDIVESIDIDISGLTEIDATLYARDVKLPANYTLLTDPNEPVIKVTASRAEVSTVDATGETAPASAEATTTE